jgi:TPR repeat protein
MGASVSVTGDNSSSDSGSGAARLSTAAALPGPGEPDVEWHDVDSSSNTESHFAPSSTTATIPARKRIVVDNNSDNEHMMDGAVASKLRYDGPPWEESLWCTPITHAVKLGETLQDIAIRYGKTVGYLTQHNGLFQYSRVDYDAAPISDSKLESNSKKSNIRMCSSISTGGDRDGDEAHKYSEQLAAMHARHEATHVASGTVHINTTRPSHPLIQVELIPEEVRENDILIPGQMIHIVPNEKDQYLWYKHGSALGHPIARYYLALMYWPDKTNDPDSQAAGSVSPMWEEDDWYANSPPGLRSLTSEQYRAHQYRIRHFSLLRESASQNYAQAQYRLGCMYADGAAEHVQLTDRQIEQEALATVEHGPGHDFQPPSDTKDSQSTTKRGSLSLQHSLVDDLGGDYDPQDDSDNDENVLDHGKLAKVHLEAAADQGHQASCRRLADMYLAGDLIKASYKKAISWLQKAGDPLAEARVFEWYRRDATSMVDVNPSSALQVAKMHMEGVGTEVDFSRAKWYFQQAGKDEAYIVNARRVRLRKSRPLYEQLFRSYCINGLDEMGRETFSFFYKDLYMARGQTKRQADLKALSTYQGNQHCEVMFNSFDTNKDGRISFAELWNNTHFISQMQPTTDKQLRKAEAYLSRFEQSGTTVNLQEYQVYLQRKKELGRVRSSRSMTLPPPPAAAAAAAAATVLSHHGPAGVSTAVPVSRRRSLAAAKDYDPHTVWQ